jgi:hypothetical protein
MKTHHRAATALILAGTIVVAASPLVGPATAAVAAASSRPVSSPGAAGTQRLAPPGPLVDATPVLSAPDGDTLRSVPNGNTPETVHIGLPDILEPEPGVNDPVFSILTRLVTSGTYGTVTQERLQREVARMGGKSRLPYESVVSITRMPVEPGKTALIRLEFKKPIHLPIPYSILGYHPGSFNASQHCLFREWEIGKIQLAEGELKDGRTVIHTIDLEDVHLFASVEGDVNVDIDAWIDALLGDLIDDTDITALMLCRWQGEWYGVAMGYGHDKSGRSGILSLRQDKILMPPPDGLRGVGRQMRAKAEYLGKVWDTDEARLGDPGHAPRPGP